MGPEKKHIDIGNIKALLFDLDGTLIDTEGIILRSMRHTVNDVYGLGVTDGELMAGVGTPLLDQMMNFIGGDEPKAEEMVAVYRKHNDAIHDEGIRSFPDTRNALEALYDAGYPMGVVTSKRHHMAVRGLEECGIGEFFEFVIGSDDWPEHKPAPGSILHGCELIGYMPDECMYIGDSPFDIMAGNAAGCMTCAALWGMFSELVLEAENPDLEISNLSELPGILVDSQ